MRNKLFSLILFVFFIFALNLTKKNSIWTPFVKFGIPASAMQGASVLDDDFNLDVGQSIPVRYRVKEATFLTSFNNYNFGTIDFVWHKCNYSVGFNFWGKIVYIETRQKYPLSSDDEFYFNTEFITTDGVCFETDIAQLKSEICKKDTTRHNTFHLVNSNWFVVKNELDNYPNKFYKTLLTEPRKTEKLNTVLFILMKFINAGLYPSLLFFLFAIIMGFIPYNNRKIAYLHIFCAIYSVCFIILMIMDWFIYSLLCDYFLPF